MIKAVLIDDEVHCIDTLTMLIADYCPEVEVVEQCVTAKQGLAAIEKYEPQLVFLDIEMPVMNGFELLEQFNEIPFAIIFTTSYDQYAIKAIRFSALDYLLKPVDPKELVTAVRKASTQKALPSAEQFNMLIERIRNKQKGFHKIAVPTSQGFELLPTDQVIRLEASDNYTCLYIKDKNKITVCRSLKEMEEQLLDYDFFLRVHHSYLVNLNEVTKYVKGEGGYLVMSDGSIVDVSRSRKETLLKKLQRMG